MNLKRVFDFYKEEMNYEIFWDILLFNRDKSKEAVLINEEDGRYWGADPFLYEYKGVTYLFYEQYDRKNKKGRIVYRILQENMTVSRAQVAIEENYHMSFPFIFSFDGEIYMIPETSNAAALYVYRAKQFPQSWERYKRLLTITSVDTIMVKVTKDELILHTSVGDSCSVENYLIRLNPMFEVVEKRKIKSESDYGNRNGGALIKRADNVYRVGQDCSNGDYGKGLLIYKSNDIENEEEIQYLSVNDFLSFNAIEKSAKQYCGIHTYNESKKFSVIDLKYLRKRKFYEKWKFIARKFINHFQRKIFGEAE